MKKQAYILAYQKATNYGAVLQIYALKRVLEKHNLMVKVVDYIPKWMKVTLKNQPSVMSYVKRKVMNLTFKSFFKRLGLTEKTFYSNSSLCKHLTDGEFYFVGSDQVWNRNIMKNDPTYFLDFAPNGAKRIGYAISMGNKALEEPFKSKAYDLISQFDHLSARENYVSEFINEKFPDEEVPVVLDPTLLLDIQDYTEVCDTKTFKNDFIAVYSAMRDQRLYDLAFHLREITGLPIVNLGYHYKGPDKHEYFKGPGNWLNRIKQARYFITNSFHGTVFAILGKSNFFVVPNENPGQKGLNARFIELLDSLDLSSQIVSNKDELELQLNANVDYSKSFKLLDQRREISMNYIQQALK
ncbi:polysaccharide pyruvyl transferase family protein [Carboxylicivirga sp. RSCT41]|uniref:polysaccharide pyruvyl transferase family protein n=1 Tax=Carboxylicivirga agarovorans TaxID=3417570 RepID=UPI003D343C0F